MPLPRLTPDTPDKALLQAIGERATNRDAAMRLLFERHTQRLMRHVRFRFNLPEAVAEDLVAQTFLRAYEKAGEFRGECEVASWLVQIARNLALDYLRKENRMESLDDDTDEDAAPACELVDPQATPDMQLQDKRVEACVKERFASFRLRHPEAATALWERHVNETSPQELAPILGREYGATRQYLSEWSKKLRTFIAPCYAMLRED